ncbi:MAG TPA: aminotransferase class I/II-fold pyridoxal phosphate-dependent enzyme [Blastocatellia bacterium]
MVDRRRATGSDYIEWAKTRSQARFNLATSGVLHYPIAELPVAIDDIELSGPSWYGYEPLQQALAAKCGVSRENVVAAIGTSMANHLAMAAILEAGDEALIEHPAYDPIVSTASYLGATVKRFERRFEEDFRIDLDEVERAVTDRTRLIAITNLHNPSSALVDDATLRQLGEIARRVGARVLVDEVYLEALFDRAPSSAFHLGNEFVITSSLTKAYGLSGLRCGWVLAEAELAERMWRLNDLFGNIPAHPAERLSVIALKNLDRIGARARALLEKNRGLLNQFLDSRDDLDAFRPGIGTVVFPRLLRGSVDKLCALLRDKYETSVVPGNFFEMRDHIRIGIGCDSEMLAGGLERLGAALDELARRS